MPTPRPDAHWPATLVSSLVDDALAHGTRVLGISGLQGTGKSTLAAQLVAAARARGLRCAALSLDDLYLDHEARRALAARVHPLLATRGPPGTHEVALGCALLDDLRDGGAVRLPRFDKRTDRRCPADTWPGTGPLDLLVFEGWCIGAVAESEAALVQPVNTLERDEDADGIWRRSCNAALARDYPALWQRIDRLVFLQPPGFEVVPQWRWEQEQALARTCTPGDGSPAPMTRAAVARFVQHYERVSRALLRTLPQRADGVLRLDAQRRILGARWTPLSGIS